MFNLHYSIYIHIDSVKKTAVNSNWKTIQELFVEKDKARLKNRCSHKISEERFEEMFERFTQQDFIDAISVTPFENLKHIGPENSGMRAFLFGGETEIGGFTFKHLAELYIKITDDGLLIWNFSISK